MVLVSLSALIGCELDLSASPAGMYIDSTTENYLKTMFEETKECSELSEGTFKEISVVIMPPVFPCRYYDNGCGGEYREPNLVKLGSYYVWRHEVIHYLLYKNTGQSDANHESELFKNCT